MYVHWKVGDSGKRNYVKVREDPGRLVGQKSSDSSAMAHRWFEVRIRYITVTYEWRSILWGSKYMLQLIEGMNRVKVTRFSWPQLTYCLSASCNVIHDHHTQGPPSCFSACNIEKLGMGLGTVYFINSVCRQIRVSYSLPTLDVHWHMLQVIILSPATKHVQDITNAINLEIFVVKIYFCSQWQLRK